MSRIDMLKPLENTVLKSRTISKGGSWTSVLRNRTGQEMIPPLVQGRELYLPPLHKGGQGGLAWAVKKLGLGTLPAFALLFFSRCHFGSKSLEFKPKNDHALAAAKKKSSAIHCRVNPEFLTGQANPPCPPWRSCGF